MPINISFQTNAVIILNSIPSFLLYRSTLPQRPLIWVYSGLAFHGFTLHSLKCSPLKVSVFSASLDKLCGIIRSRERMNSPPPSTRMKKEQLQSWDSEKIADVILVLLKGILMLLTVPLFNLFGGFPTLRPEYTDGKRGQGDLDNK